MLPIYIKVKNDIINKIEAGEYVAGKKIPSERVLSDQYGVSRMTIRQAINELVGDGIVSKRQGSGTYVNTPQFSQRNVRSFTETLKSQGYEPSTKVLEFSRVHHIKAVSEALDQPLETSYYKLKRLRYGNGLPMALEMVYFPIDMCPGIETFDESDSLYKVLSERFNYDIGQVSYEIDALISNRMMMKAFELEKPVALLKVTGVSYVEQKVPLLYEESFYRPDLYKYSVDIYKR